MVLWLITDGQDRPDLHIGHSPFTFRKAKKLITKTVETEMDSQ